MGSTNYDVGLWDVRLGVTASEMSAPLKMCIFHFNFIAASAISKGYRLLIDLRFAAAIVQSLFALFLCFFFLFSLRFLLLLPLLLFLSLPTSSSSFFLSLLFFIFLFLLFYGWPCMSMTAYQTWTFIWPCSFRPMFPEFFRTSGEDLLGMTDPVAV